MMMYRLYIRGISRDLWKFVDDVVHFQVSDAFILRSGGSCELGAWELAYVVQTADKKRKHLPTLFPKTTERPVKQNRIHYHYHRK